MLKKILLSTFIAGSFAAQAQTARVQVIHNCADAVADSVDVYVNGAKALDNFAFRTATPFINLPANAPIMVGIAPKNSSSVSDTIYNLEVTLDPTKTYIVVASGIVSAMGYNPAPAFGLKVYDMGREAATMPGNTDVLVMHGASDAPTVDVRAGGNVLVDDISYGQFSNGYLSLPTSDYTVNITDASGSTTVQSYSAPLQTLSLQGAALTVLASGFLTPANNSGGPSLGLYVALPVGGSLIPLPVATTNVSQISGKNSAVKIYPNPANDRLFITGLSNEAQLYIMDFTGKIQQSETIGMQTEVNVSNLSEGTYLVKVVSNGNEQVLRFVKR
ncbi:MAG TPA: DUF4397 domain-containing protein [Flavipsychrobacter sp.]|nr:DUF4397 domain-containing protein [Flavipsychrobacter sp.]